MSRRRLLSPEAGAEPASVPGVPWTAGYAEGATALHLTQDKRNPRAHLGAHAHRAAGTSLIRDVFSEMPLRTSGRSRYPSRARRGPGSGRDTQNSARRSGHGSTDDQRSLMAESIYGKKNRLRALNNYLKTAGPLNASNAWLHVYRLLLSVDRRTRLAHIYDANHMQPGWQFHDRAVMQPVSSRATWV